MDEQANEWVFGWTDGCVDEHMDLWVNRWMNLQVNGWMAEWTDWNVDKHTDVYFGLNLVYFQRKLIRQG